MHGLHSYIGGPVKLSDDIKVEMFLNRDLTVTLIYWTDIFILESMVWVARPIPTAVQCTGMHCQHCRSPSADWYYYDNLI